jgi:hypothetical protein
VSSSPILFQFDIHNVPFKDFDFSKDKQLFLEFDEYKMKILLITDINEEIA